MTLKHDPEGVTQSRADGKAPTAQGRTSRLVVTLALTGVVASVEFVFSLQAHSIGLLSDAGHNFVDVATVIVAMTAVRLALRPRTDVHSFGLHRGTILAALVNASLLLVTTVAIAVEAALHLAHPHPVRGVVVLVVAAGSMIANLIAAAVLTDRRHIHAGDNHHRPPDLNMYSVWLHMVGDALAAGMVLVAGVVLVIDHRLVWVDPVASLVVAMIIGFEAVEIWRRSLGVLLESSPSDLDLTEVRSSIARVPGVSDVHDLHVWSLSSDLRALSAHVMVAGNPTIDETRAVVKEVKDRLRQQFAIAHATLELEGDRCAETHVDPCGFDHTTTHDSAGTLEHTMTPRRAGTTGGGNSAADGRVPAERG